MHCTEELLGMNSLFLELYMKIYHFITITVKLNADVVEYPMEVASNFFRIQKLCVFQFTNFKDQKLFLTKLYCFHSMNYSKQSKTIMYTRTLKTQIHRGPHTYQPGHMAGRMEQK